MGFAAETGDLLENARGKLQSKSLDLIVANNVTADHSGFGSDDNKVLIVDRNGTVEDLPLMSKDTVAHHILDRVGPLLRDR